MPGGDWGEFERRGERSRAGLCLKGVNEHLLMSNLQQLGDLQ